MLELLADLLELVTDLLELSASLLELSADLLEVSASLLELVTDLLELVTDLLDRLTDLLEISPVPRRCRANLPQPLLCYGRRGRVGFQNPGGFGAGDCGKLTAGWLACSREREGEKDTA